MLIWKNKSRRNRKIKFNENNYVKKHYINEEGKAVIPIKIDKLDDLYMKFDYKQIELSDEICNYIEEIAYMIPIDMDIILEIHCNKIKKEEQEKVKKTIKNNYGMEIDDIDYDLKKENNRFIIIFIIGIILLILNLLSDKYMNNAMLSNFISVVWWVAIWDTVEYILMDKKDNKFKRLNYQQLYDAKIIFKIN